MPAYTLTPAQVAALKVVGFVLTPARSAKPKAGKVAARTFKTRAQRLAGEGFACTVAEPCSRTDLRTSGRTGSHDIATGHTAR